MGPTFQWFLSKIWLTYKLNCLNISVSKRSRFYFSVFDDVITTFYFQLYAAIGSSLGGMCSVAMAALYPSMVSRMISISACTQSHPSSIALRYLQRRCIMEDPNWNRGHYYGLNHPIRGMKLARCVYDVILLMLE